MLVADDLIAFADRVAPEELYRKRLSEAADEPEFRVRREELRAQYRKVHVKAAVARGVPRIQAEKRYDEATRRGSTTIGEREYVPLTPEHVLYRPDGRAFTVADIQADPAAYHGIECADPIEGLDYQSKNCAIIYSDGDAAGRIRIYSRAHSDAFCYVAPLDPETPWDDVFEDVGLDVVETTGRTTTRPRVQTPPRRTIRALSGTRSSRLSARSFRSTSCRTICGTGARTVTFRPAPTAAPM